MLGSMKFPTYDGELEPTTWVACAYERGRPNDAIYRLRADDKVVRASPFSNWTAESVDGKSLPTQQDIQRALDLRMAEVGRLRRLGLKVVDYSEEFVLDNEGNPYFLTTADYVEPEIGSLDLETKDMTIAGLIDYVTETYVNITPVMVDIFYWRQFTFGRAGREGLKHLWLVDIDPLCPNPKAIVPGWAKTYRMGTPAECSDDITFTAMRRIDKMVESLYPFTEHSDPNDHTTQAVIRKLCLDNANTALRNYYYARAFYTNMIKGNNVWTTRIKRMTSLA